MSILPWEKKKQGVPLSAYIDDELDCEEQAEIGERVVFEPQARELLDLFHRAKDLVDRAAIPERVPAQEISEQLRERADAGDGLDPDPQGSSSWQKRNSVAILSVGLLVTAGVALLGLRRRGLV